MEIRTAEMSDLVGLSQLFDRYRQFYKQQPDVDGAQAFIQERLTQKDSIVFIACEGPLPIGFVQLYPCFSSVAMQRIYILNDLFIDPAARSKGVATALFKKSEEFAAEAGAIRLELATETTNTSAQALYEKLGWQKNEMFIHFNKRIEA